ncbi:unnamed protein product [Rotaria socialis]|uniref:MARVEL domain-containing protein n=1 Tax=Rotaria socialis TaxID=392032 RepID=A0A817XUC7_9BILA|nr:unnamed protein product [Rotaria socialis]CAF3341620.1 unnamed protein product [Rotaria socialis]CAF3370550.1 unnamed protein product [Rotaria socialis]CAF3512021.1 unnamed protein product [Rotaria socialis]CAF3687710.1 unnamed protein product [Rotaria socialis]
MAFYFGVLKEPRGLIRLLQFIFAIFAFATACNGSSYLYIQQGSNSNTASVGWSYPYDLRGSQIITTNTAITNKTVYLSQSNSIAPSAQFFVFTGVTSMLLALGFLVIYIVLDRQYRYNDRIPIVDFVVTIIWTIFWIAGSSAWAQGVSNIQIQTSFSYVSSLLDGCSSGSACQQNESGTYANVTVSVIFGFLNFILWVGSVWFVYKETRFFKSRTAQQNPPQNNFSNISASNMQQQPQTRMPGTMG